MAEVFWSDAAIFKLDQIVDYLEQFDPAAADRTARDLFVAGESLCAFPNRGRQVAAGLRELVSVWPYIITYEVDGDRVTIVNIRHGAQRAGLGE